MIPDAETIAQIADLQIRDMPPSPDQLGLMLDLAQANKNLASRADVWRAIGIHPKDGRAFLTHRNERCNWPVWFTLRHLAGLEERQARE
jgi:hypothetical protein